MRVYSGGGEEWGIQGGGSNHETTCCFSPLVRDQSSEHSDGDMREEMNDKVEEENHGAAVITRHELS